MGVVLNSDLIQGSLAWICAVRFGAYCGFPRAIDTQRRSADYTKCDYSLVAQSRFVLLILSA